MAEVVPCQVCGSPTRSAFGICQASAACLTVLARVRSAERRKDPAYREAERTRGQRPKCARPAWCMSCGIPLTPQNQIGICQSTPECEHMRYRVRDMVDRLGKDN